jgi:hypothetical protein
VPHGALYYSVRCNLTQASAEDVPERVELKMRNACSFERSFPSGLDRGNRPVRTNGTRKEKRVIRTLFLFPRLQNFACVFGKRNRFRRARGLYVVIQTDQLSLKIHLVPTQRKPLAIYARAFVCVSKTGKGSPQCRERRGEDRRRDCSTDNGASAVRSLPGRRERIEGVLVGNGGRCIRFGLLGGNRANSPLYT